MAKGNKPVNKNKELKKLNRGELLTMLISITQRCDELEAELEEANKKLEDRSIVLNNSGTMAEAAMMLNGVMEAVDKASAQYVENLQRMYGNPDDGAQAMINRTREQCSRIESETKVRCTEMIEHAKAESQAYWDNVYAKIQQYSAIVEQLKAKATPGEKE